jgi:hypothetical protein
MTGIKISSQHKEICICFVEILIFLSYKTIIKHTVQSYLMLLRLLKNYIIINSLKIPITRINLYGTLLRWKQKSNDNGPPLNINRKTF